MVEQLDRIKVDNQGRKQAMQKRLSGQVHRNTLLKGQKIVNSEEIEMNEGEPLDMRQIKVKVQEVHREVSHIQDTESLDTVPRTGVLIPGLDKEVIHQLIQLEDMMQQKIKAKGRWGDNPVIMKGFLR